MKLLSFRYQGTDYWGVEKQDGIYYSDQLMTYFPTLLSVIENYEHINLEKDLNKFVEINDVKILPPFKPRKNIMCIGKNYREHALEMSNQDTSAIPEHPVVFTKSPSSVIGHLDSIEPHSHVTDQLDYEGELVVIIGRRGKNIERKNAMDYVFGFTIMNDVTARDRQKRHKQFYLGKSLDTFAPIGPYVVPRKFLSQPQQLSIKTFVNDEIRQNGNTKDMIFSIEQLIEELSQGMTLEPGDLIATGTPSGVGKGFNPPRFLKSGDTVRIEVEGIGELINTVN